MSEDNVLKHSFNFHYILDKVDLDENYLDNANSMALLRDYLLNAERVDSIVVYAYASPEGPSGHNRKLSEKRAISAKNMILENLKQNGKVSSEIVFARPMGENWAGLRVFVENDGVCPARDEVLKIIDSDVSDDVKEYRLRRLNSGDTHDYILENIMPRLRVAAVVCVYTDRRIAALCPPAMPMLTIPMPEDTSHIVFPVIVPDTEIEPETESLPEAKVLPQYKRTTILSAKTNLLFDAVTALNAEVEVPIGQNFSVAAEYVFPWWTFGPNGKKYSLEMLQLGIEPRWWFHKNQKRDKLAGHFIGVYGMGLKYDFQWDKTLCYQGYGWSAGLTYGYSLPVGKWMDLELSLSVGYLRTDYQHYQPDLDYEHLYRDPLKAGTFSYFGPTKAKISLVFPIKVKTKIRQKHQK